MANGRISVSRDAVKNLITTLGKYKSDLDEVRQNLEWGLHQLEKEWNDDDFQRFREEAIKISKQIDHVSHEMLDNDLIPRTKEYFQQIEGIQFR
jgi:hypothetical protein